MREIIIIPYNDGWKAYLADMPGWWALGKTYNEALSELVRTAATELQLKITVKETVST